MGNGATVQRNESPPKATAGADCGAHTAADPQEAQAEPERSNVNKLWRVCGTKIGYETEAAAWVKVAKYCRHPAYKAKPKSPLSVYRCPHCNLWHVGHTPAKYTLLDHVNASYWSDAPNLEWINDWAWRQWWKARGEWKPMVNVRP